MSHNLLVGQHIHLRIAKGRAQHGRISADEKSVAGELGFEPRFSESESDVLPLNYSPFGAVKRLFYKDKRDQRRENISDFLVANATICSR